MSGPFRVLGDERGLAIAGLDPPPAPDAPTIHLGPTTEPADLIWLPGPAPETARGQTPYGGVGSASPAVIATSGEGLWSRAPWPARDELFELPRAPAARVLVVCPDAERGADVAEKLEARGRPVTAAAALTAADLAAASIVALLGDAGAATDRAPWADRAMPAEAPAVLAARRILIAPRCEVTFGLLPGTDHLAFGTADDVVQYADAALTFPESFEPFPVLGALAAEHHRASRVYARLGDELRSARRSSAPAG